MLVLLDNCVIENYISREKGVNVHGALNQTIVVTYAEVFVSITQGPDTPNVPNNSWAISQRQHLHISQVKSKEHVTLSEELMNKLATR